MFNLNIGIYEHDKSYAESLAQFFITSESQQFSVSLFFQEEQLLEYLKTHSLDILLIPDLLYLKLNNLKNIEVVIMLIEDFVRPELVEIPYVKKFQKASCLIQEIRYIYTNKCDKELSSNPITQACLIGVYSSTGGSGKTTVSLGVAQALSDQGHKTLFISLEAIPSYNILLNRNNDKSISDLFYYYSLKVENIIMKQEGIRIYDEDTKLFYLPPPIHPNDLNLFSEVEWIDLINVLKSKSQYQYIVMDFTCEFSIRNRNLFEICDKKIYLVNPSFKCFHQIEYLKKALMMDVDTTFFEHVIFVLNNIGVKDEANEEVADSNIVFEVPYIETLLCKNVMEKTAFNHNFIEIIKKLLEVIHKSD